MEFRPIPGFSNYLAGEDGFIYSHFKGGNSKGVSSCLRRLNGCIDKSSGYLRVHIIGDRGRILEAVHVLIALAYKGPKPVGTLVRHYDDVKTNNVPTNLFYGTQLENKEDARRNGRPTGGASGEGHWNCKLSDSDVREIKYRLTLDGTGAELAREFGISSMTISNIKTGLRRRTVGS